MSSIVSREGPPSRTAFLLAVAVALYLVQVLPYISYRWVTDESWYTATAYSIAHGNGFAVPPIGPNDLEHQFDARPPGTALVIAAAFKLFGASQVAARLGSILAGLAIVALVYLLAIDVIGETGAWAACLLAATDNLTVLTARTARPEALTAAFVLLALMAMKQFWRVGRVGWAFAAGLALACGTMFHVTLAGFLISLGLLAILAGRGSKSRLLGVGMFAAAYLLGLVPFALWIWLSPLGLAGFHREFLNRAADRSLWTRFIEEGHRYSDLLGQNILHGHGLENIPLRLPILLIIAFASLTLWKLQRRWFYLELLLLFPSILWFIYTLNKSSRYLSLISPIFALVIGASIGAAAGLPRLRRVLITLACLTIAAQLSANLFLLHRAESANYNKVTAELRGVIPPGASTYGTMIFWLALCDHPYVAFERTDPQMAVRDFNVQYFIMGDHVMTEGAVNQAAYSRSLRLSMNYLEQQCDLIAEFQDPFYGDMKVCKVKR